MCQGISEDTETKNRAIYVISSSESFKPGTTSVVISVSIPFS